MTPLCKWLTLSGPTLYDENEYDDIVIEGVRWGDMKSQFKFDRDRSSTNEEKIRKFPALAKRLYKHQKEVNIEPLIKPDDIGTVNCEADVLSNLKRVISTLPNDTYHEPAAQNLVNYLKENPLSAIYDPNDYEERESE